MTLFHSSYRRLHRVCIQTASPASPLWRCFAARLWIPLTMHSQPGPHKGGKIERFFRKPGTGHSPQDETETQLPDQEKPDQEKLADYVETEMLHPRRELAAFV